MDIKLKDGEYYIITIGVEGKFVAYWREDKNEFQIPGNWTGTKLEHCKQIVPFDLAIRAVDLITLLQGLAKWHIPSDWYHCGDFTCYQCNLYSDVKRMLA